MKIQNISNLSSYNCSSKSVKSGEMAKIKKYDVIDIKSRTDNECTGADIASVKRNIVSEINRETKADKLTRIKSSIDNKTYRIDTEEIALRMMK